MTALIPASPDELDRIPPADLDLCPVCLGRGQVLDAVDENGRPVDRACPVCDGTGTLPLGGAA